jgi:type II secretory pathway pseudopilin PulG
VTGAAAGRSRAWRSPPGRRALALVEIVMALGMLSVVSVTALRLFAQGANRENHARDLDMAVFEAQRAVEAYKTNPAGAAGELWFGADWTPVASAGAAAFTLTLTVSEKEAPAGVWETATAAVTARRPYLLETEGGEIFSLSAVVYRPEGRPEP